MKQIIKDVLNLHGEMNVNLASDSARDVIAIEIIEKLKKKGFYTEYRKDELEKKEAKKGWVCQTCGKSTFETDYDYLVHPKLHLGCALEEELKGKDIKEQYLTASAEYYKDEKRMKPSDWWNKENPQLELMLDERKKEGPDYDDQGNSAVPYLPGKYTESVEEPEGTPYSPEEVEAWNRSVEDCGTQQPYDKYRKKLSEDIVDNKDVKYIYESPDGGKTIYRRKFGEYGKRELVKDWNKEKERIVDGHLIIEDKKSG